MREHPIFLVAPNGLNLTEYKKILGNDIIVEFFDEYYFIGISGYNKLMLTKDFYLRFSAFKYLLIYQLDCYVFRDELNDWCELNYDYIGAPWIDTSIHNLNIFRKLFYFVKRKIKRILSKNLLNDKSILTNNVGNGGFSLRKTDKFISVLNETDDTYIKKFTESNDPKSLFNEDVFWSFIAKKIKKPHFKEACKFSLDLGADIGIRLNNNKLPFGCHAWNKKYYYWEKYIV
ncbi:DUF5672 family protein [Petrimonas sp.]|uniref:DUF5672 family protein n=1 Tax=Petrimonas sp. TaxID=2023866 RepID=UPI0030D160E8